MTSTNAKAHDYHILPSSPWPILLSLSVFIMIVGGVCWMRSDDAFLPEAGPFVFLFGFLSLSVVASFWWRDVVHEARAGDHTPLVQLHHRYGMILFIISEVMFFVAWFWAYFDVALFPDAISQPERTAFLGGTWPPTGLTLLDPFEFPLFNTLILLTSGTTVTWAHHALLEGDRKGLIRGLFATIALGVLFLFVQAYEYMHADFPFADNIYGATFFMATGFHGLHVLIGTIFLAVCLARALKGDFTERQHLGFEFAAWYWHFVDVVWLFLFATIYIWGSDFGRAVIAH